MAAAQVRWMWWVFLALVTLWQVYIPNAEGAESLDVYEKIKYHLQELNSGLGKLGKHAIYKRSALNHEEVIYNSLRAFCNELNPQINQAPSSSSGVTPDQTPPTSTSTGTSEEENISSMTIPAPTKTDVPVTTSISTWPHVFPIKIRGQRVGDAVWLLFDLMHSAPVTVYRLFSFDTQKLFVDYPRELSKSKAFLPIISKVRVKVDATACGNLSMESAARYTAIIGFTLHQQSSYHTTTEINLCTFDYFQNTTIPYDENRWMKKPETIITEKVPLLYLKIISSDPGDQIVLEKGQNVRIELEIHAKGQSQISFQVQLWDRQKKGKILKSFTTLHIYDGSIQTHQSKGGMVENDLIVVEVLDPVAHQSHREGKSFNHTVGEMKSDDGDNVEGEIIKTRVRLTVATSNGKRSGKLILSYFHVQAGQDKLLETISAVRTISLKLPNRSFIFPRNYVEITTPEEGSAFECDKSGNRHYSKMSKNCTIFCQAFGTDIKDIFISNSQPHQPEPVDSSSLIFDDGSYAMAMLNMGLASEKIDGTYRCTAIASNGKKKRREVKLFTSFFTQVRTASLREFGNGTILLTCEAFGAQPLNVSILAFKNDGTTERLDNKTTNTRTYTVEGHLSNLTLWLSADQLNLPTTQVDCHASGERGNSGHALDISFINAPKIDRMPNVSTIYDYANGTALITCAANGAKPLELWLTYGGNSENFRIDNDPEYRRWTSETKDGTALHLLVTVDSFSPRSSWLGCRASNQFGDDWHDFYITDFIRFP